MHSQGNNALQITGWCSGWFSRTACYQLWPLGLHSGIWFLASSFYIFSGQLFIGSHTSLLIKWLINLVLWPSWRITRRKLEFQTHTQRQFLSNDYRCDPWKHLTGLLIQDFFSLQFYLSMYLSFYQYHILGYWSSIVSLNNLQKYSFYFNLFFFF